MFSKMSFFLTLLTFGILISSCSEPKGTTIKGSIANAENLSVYFDNKTLENAIQSLGNQELNSGKFNFNFPEGLDPGMYRVRVGAKSIELILKGDEKLVELEGDVNTLQDFEYTVSGSPMSVDFQNTLKDIIDKKMDREALLAKIMNDSDPLLGTSLIFGTTPGNPELHEAYTALSNKLKDSYPTAKITSEMSNFAQK